MGSEIIFSRHIFVKSTTFCSVSTFYAIYAEVNSVKFLSNETDMLTVFISTVVEFSSKGTPFLTKNVKNMQSSLLYIYYIL